MIDKRDVDDLIFQDIWQKREKKSIKEKRESDVFFPYSIMAPPTTASPS